MKIYTKMGDRGETGIIGSERLAKSDVRICAIGAVDEANAIIGWVGTAMDHRYESNDLLKLIPKVQSALFEVGADLASPNDTRFKFSGQSLVAILEESIDQMNLELASLVNFVLPGGSEVASRFHMARGAVRRAEREVSLLNEHFSVNSTVQIFINRLSDWLFVAARYANHIEEIDDVKWSQS